MTISDDIKQAVEAEYKAWEDQQYAGMDKKERQKMGAFFTPPELSIKMLEKFDSVTDKDILDPTLGAGGLIAAAIIAGADPSRCYGIELDPNVLAVAKRRLVKLGVPPCNLIQGDALDPVNYDKFNETPASKTFAALEKTDDGVVMSVVKDGKFVKQIKYADRNALKSVLEALVKKGVPVLK